jgi:hypothetical protein
MDAEKLAGLLREVAESRHLAGLVLRGSERFWALAGLDDWITDVSVRDGLVRAQCECKHGQPDWQVIDPAEVIAVRWQTRGHDHDDGETRGNIL